MMWIYRALLRCYPEWFRSAFGDEILATVARVEADRAHCGKLTQIVSAVAEVSGLVAGILVERFRSRDSATALPALASATQQPVPDEIAELEESIRFHLAQTLDCIAHHRFAGARFHTREEEQDRERLRNLLK